MWPRRNLRHDDSRLFPDRRRHCGSDLHRVPAVPRMAQLSLRAERKRKQRSTERDAPHERRAEASD
jgi:hypothetical protein